MPDSYDDLLKEYDQQQGARNTAGTAGVAPDAAVQAIKAQRAGGPPAVLGMQQGNDTGDNRGLSAGPIPSNVAAYAARDPARAAAVSDDHPALQQLGVMAQAWSDFTKPFKEANAKATIGAQRMLAAQALKPDETHGRDKAFPVAGDALDWRNWVPGFTEQEQGFFQWIGGTLQGSFAPVTGAVSAVAGRPLAKVAKPVVPNGPWYDKENFLHPDLQKPMTEEQATQYYGNVIGNALFLGRGKGEPSVAAPEAFAPPPKPAGPPEPGGRFGLTEDGLVAASDGSPVTFTHPKQAAQWILKQGYAKSPDQIFEIANGATPNTWVVKQSGIAEPPVAPGASPVHDAVYKAQAEADSANLAAMEEATAATKTHSRDPALIDEFVTQQAPDGVVYVSPQAIADIWASGDKVFEDRLPDVEQALRLGRDVEVPLGQYLAEVSGKPFAEQLRQGVRVRPDGVSPQEAKELPEALKPAEVTEESGETVPDNENKELVPYDYSAHTVDLTPEEKAQVNEAAPAIGEAVGRASKNLYLNKLFQDAKSVGMTETQFKLYSKKVEQAVADAHAKIFDRIVKQLKRERTPEWKTEVAQLAAEAEQELFARPDIQAYSYLRYNQAPDGAPLANPAFAQKLNKQDVVRAYGQSVADSIPKEMYGKLGEGESADDLAELFGYDTGAEMIGDIIKLDDAITATKLSGLKAYVQQVSKAQGVNVAREALGFDLSPEGIEAAAQEALASPKVEDLLIDELKELAKSAGLPFDKDAIRARAEELFDEMTVKQATNIREHERVVSRLGREAEVALLKGKTPDAFRAKEKQVLNQLILGMSHGFVKDVARTQRKFGVWASHPSMRTVAQEYMNYIHEQLARMGVAVARNEEELLAQLGGKSVEEFILEKRNEGRVIAWGPYPPGPLKNMFVYEYRAARDTITSLHHNGVAEKTVEVAGKRADFDAQMERVKANGDALGRKLTPARLEKMSVSGAAGRAARGMNAPMIRMEQLLDEMDLNDPLGPLNEMVTYPMQEAKGLENDLLAKATASMKEFAKAQPKDWLGTMRVKVDAPELTWTNPRTGVAEPRIITKGQLVRAALNRGNAGNYGKLLEGYGWDKDVFESVMDRVLTKADMDFVQKVWDLYEELWPLLESNYRELAGVAPTKVKPVAFTFKGKEYAGGYFPLKYDRLRAPDVKTFSPDSIWGDDYTSALPANSYTKGRTKYAAPIDLNFEGLMAGLGQHIHDIAFRKPLLQSHKVLTNAVVKHAAQDNFGPEYVKQFVPWMEYVARERVFDDKAADWLSNIMAQGRANITFVGLAYRNTSAMIHGGVALSDSIAEVGVVDFTKAMSDIYLTPTQWNYWFNYISENSPEIRNRLVNMDQNIREAVERMAVKQGFLDNVQQYGYHMLALSDNFSAMPTWLAAVRQETAKGRSPTQAFAIADKRVRQAHGASAAVDIPALQRRGGSFFSELGQSTFGLFLSFMNHAYNRLWGIGRQYGRAFDQAKYGEWAGATRDFNQAMARTMFYTLIPAIVVTEIHALANKHKKFTLGDWIDGIAHTTFGGYPGMGTILSLIDHKTQNSPVDNALNDMGATGWNIWHAATGHTRKVNPKWLQQGMNTVGYWTGKVPGQFSASAQFLWNWSTGAEHPKTVGEIIHGIMFGPKPQRKHK